jgi:hypothetical protein
LSRVDALTEEQQEAIVSEALGKFVEYLNLWWNNDWPDELDPYTVEKFTVTDPKRGLYGETTWKVLEEPIKNAAFPTAVIKIETDDGDEGGGSILYVGCQGERSISWIIHLFDLQPAAMWNEADGFRTPEKA